MFDAVGQGIERRERKPPFSDERHRRFHQSAADASVGIGGLDRQRTQDERAAPIHAYDAADDTLTDYSDETGTRIRRPARTDDRCVAAKLHRIGEPELRPKG